MNKRPPGNIMLQFMYQCPTSKICNVTFWCSSNCFL